MNLRLVLKVTRGAMRPKRGACFQLLGYIRTEVMHMAESLAGRVEE